ncbi:MAG: ABC transporter permease [Clostridia bacterium]|nr:ABC transporter permease [Clostridia bacterium]
MQKKHLTLPYIVWMIMFTVVPILLVFLYGMTKTNPFGDTVFTWDNIERVFQQENLKVLGRSVLYAAITTAICLILAYPTALILVKMKSLGSSVVSMLFILPMWMNFLLRTYAWRALLETTGPINSFLGLLGIAPKQFLFTESAVILGLVYNFFPFMLLPIRNVCEKIPESYNEAAEDLGANKWQTLLRVTLPLTKPGIITGITMVFMPTVTTFIISRLLGGSQYMMYGDVIENQFMLLRDWNFGSALAVVMMIMMLISMAILRKYDKDGEVSAL